MDRDSIKKSDIFKYFTESSDKKHYVCICEVSDASGNISTCGTKITKPQSKKPDVSSRAYNLKRHLSRLHPEISKMMEEKKQMLELSRPSTSASSKTKANQQNITKFLMSQKVTISMTTDNFKNSIIELVVKDSMPLSMFEKPAMRSLLEEMAQKFKISLDKDNIRHLVIEKSKEEKFALKEQLKGRFIYLKVDGCTRIRTHYFAINVRFIDDDNKILTRTIAVKDTHAQQTSDYLHDLIMRTLEEYGIPKEFVLCIVSDNASNMIKTVEKLNDNQEATSEDDIQTFGEHDDDSTDTQEVASCVEEIDSIVSEISHFSRINHMRCGAHTLQLAICDGLRDKHATSLIGKLRQVVVAARNPKVEEIIKRRAGKVAILDQPTRWGSTYLMIERLLELKPVLLDMANSNVNLSEIMWEQARRLERVLYQPYIVTKKIQSEDLTPGQFLKEWKSLMYFLSKIEGTIADDIKSSMERRENILLDNEVLLAAVYIDPRYRCLLTSEQVVKAKDALCNIAIRMKSNLDLSNKVSLLREECGTEIIASSSNSSSPSTTSDVSEFDFEKIIDIQHGKKSKRSRLESELIPPLSPMCTLKLQVEESFPEIEKFDRSSKLSFEQVIERYPKVMRDVSNLLVAMPSTEVSVEWLFSALKILKSDLRARMKDIVEAVIFKNKCL